MRFDFVQREAFLIFLNFSVFDIPHFGREAFEEVSVVDNGEDGPFEIGECLLKAGARGDIQMINRLIKQKESTALRDE